MRDAHRVLKDAGRYQRPPQLTEAFRRFANRAPDSRAVIPRTPVSRRRFPGY
jgi:hypothetical protein